MFLPIIFLKDVSSFIFKQQAETAAYALLASLFVGISVIPILYYKFTKENSSSAQTVNNHWYKKIESIYHRLLQQALKNSGKVIVIVVFLLAFSLILFIFLDRNESSQRVFILLESNKKSQSMTRKMKKISEAIQLMMYLIKASN